MPIAIIDLGTNTFNLAIAEKIGSDVHFLYNSKEPVKLGKGGIGNNTILPDAMERATVALERHFSTIKQFNVHTVKAVGTSALRSASNASKLINEAKNRFDFNIEIISGDREAELIYKGVKLSLEKTEKPFLILDIGGGSNEFILSDGEQIKWKQSFPIGMARLIEKFNISDPISENQIFELENYFTEQLVELFEVCPKGYASCLIGAEGAFESFYNTIQFSENPLYIPQQFLKAQPISLNKYKNFHQNLIHSTSAQRMLMKGIEPYRVEMVVPASIFVNFVFHKLGIPSMQMSPFSLKEGLAWEMLK